MATLYKEYTVIGGTFASESFPFAGANREGLASAPAWFDFAEGPIIIFQTYTGYQFTAPTELGTYDIEFKLFTGDLYYVRVNVIVGAYDLYSNCCGDRNIAWLNIEGGWQNYIFSGIKTFDVEIVDSKQFKTSGLVQKHSEITGVYTGELISTGDIPKEHADALDSLKRSIQAFLYNDDTEAWDIPILLDVGSYTKYKSNDKFWDVRVKFIYAEEILVQTQ